MKKIILASASPRRAELVSSLGLEFEVMPSGYEEELEGKQFSYNFVEETSLNKALDIAFKIDSDAFVIGADTVVVLGREILLKPKDEQEAFQMLKKLSGKEHLVVTSISVADAISKKHITRSVSTYVEFHPISDEQILNYIRDKKPLDKAGAYGIQELDETFVKNVTGDYNNVIGLCTECLMMILSQLDKTLN